MELIKFMQLDLQKSQNLQNLNLLKQQPTHKERLKILANTVDEDGNILFIGEEENRIFLRKKATREDKCLGRVIAFEKNLLYYKQEDERNIFNKTNAWSINYTIFNLVDHTTYETLKYTYQIPKGRALEFGEILKFDGTEKKIYIPLTYWDKRITVGPKQAMSEAELRRRNYLGDAWYDLLKDVINSEYMSKIGNFLRERRQVSIVYPDENLVFRALKFVHPKHAKVIILGQDPYYDGSANGLAFGFKDDSKKRPAKSLDVIYKEIERDCYKGMFLDFDNTLIPWAQQGVLLLNTILTVERGKPKSHAGVGWQRFVKIVLYELLKDLSPKVFMLWGNDAQALFREVEVKVPVNPHAALYAKHPAADLYGVDDFGQLVPNYPNTFAGCGHFSKANDFLLKHKRKPIIW